MPPRPQREGDRFWCAEWPMTLERIRDWQRAFTGAPSRRVPFGAHAVKYLMHLLEQHAATRQGVADIEQAHGNQDPEDAPWLLYPRPEGGWRHRYDPKESHVGQNTNPIPYAGVPQDKGTDAYPEWEQYEERRHERENAPLTSQERADEKQLRDAEREAEDDLSCLDAPPGDLSGDVASAAADEIADRMPETGSLSRFF